MNAVRARDDGPVVMITGATAGVGRATARLFAEHHARIGLIAREPGRLRETQQEVERLGGQAVGFSIDVSDAEKMDEAARSLEQRFGPIDVWVNNAMVTVVSDIKDMSAAEFKRVTEVCYLGFVYGTLAALRRMWERDQGKIVQVGSALAYRSIPLQSAYCGAKHAIEGFTESLRCELLHHEKNISVTMVQMPALNTPQFSWCKVRLPRKPQPVPPIYQPEVAARAIYWAAYHDRREITVGGRNQWIIWLNKFFAGVGDHYLARTGYDAQQTDTPVAADRKDNLWEPVPGPFAARGEFSDRASDSSTMLWIHTHRRLWLSLVAVVVLAAAAFAAL